FDRGRCFALPEIKLRFGLLGSGIVAIAQKSQLRLLLVEGQFRIFPATLKQSTRSAVITGSVDREDAVVFFLPGRDGIDQHASIFAQCIVQHVGVGVLFTGDGIVQNEIATVFLFLFRFFAG